MRLHALGIDAPEIVMDTEVAAYLVDPARGSYGLDELSRRYLDRELRLEEDPSGDEEGGQQAFALGANDYLVKLPDKIELIARIRYHSKAFMNLLQRDAAYRALREEH